MGSATLASCSAGAWLAIAVAESTGEVVVPEVAEAVLVTEPASRSAWVTV